MSRVKSRLLATALAATLVGGIAWAQGTQQAPTYDPAQLPEIKGKVAQYTLTPRGDVDGLILQDGTEVHVPPHLSAEIVFAVRPGDAVTVHGLRARNLPLVMAMSIANDGSGVTVNNVGGPRGPESTTEVSGTIKAPLHGPRGEVNGVLLADGTVVRMPPPEAERLQAQLVVGRPLFVRGHGASGPLGRVIAAEEIGPDAKASLTRIAGPHMPHWEHWMHEMMDHDGMGHGPRPGEPPPPPPAP